MSEMCGVFRMIERMPGVGLRVYGITICESKDDPKVLESIKTQLGSPMASMAMGVSVRRACSSMYWTQWTMRSPRIAHPTQAPISALRFFLMNARIPMPRVTVASFQSPRTAGD